MAFMPNMSDQDKYKITILLEMFQIPDSEIRSLDKQQFLHIMKQNCLNLNKEEALVLTKMWVDNNRVTKSQEQKLYEASQQETASRIPAEVVLSVGGWEEEPSRQSEMYNPLTQSWGIISEKLVLPRSSMAYFGLEVLS